MNRVICHTYIHVGLLRMANWTDRPNKREHALPSTKLKAMISDFVITEMHRTLLSTINNNKDSRAVWLIKD